MFNTT